MPNQEAEIEQYRAESIQQLAEEYLEVYLAEQEARQRAEELRKEADRLQYEANGRILNVMMRLKPFLMPYYSASSQSCSKGVLAEKDGIKYFMSIKNTKDGFQVAVSEIM